MNIQKQILYQKFSEKLIMSGAEQFIKQFDLQPHPEGGWYKQTYKSEEFISAKALPGRFNGDRAFSTAIYFLLDKGDFRLFTKLKVMNAGTFIQEMRCMFM